MTSFRTSRHGIVSVPAGGAIQSASVRGHTVLTDQPRTAGGSDSAPTPLELLAVALSSCITLYVHRYCQARSLDTSGLAVVAVPLWRADPGRIARFDVTVHIPDCIPATHHAGIEAAARNCPVHHTLTHAPEVSIQLHADALAAATA